MNTSTGPPGPAALSAALMEFGELLKPLGEFIDGQREDLRRRGYTQEIAEGMVAELHRHVLWLMRAGQAGR